MMDRITKALTAEKYHLPKVGQYTPIKVARELGSERRETVRSLSIVGVGNLRGSDISTRGPCWTDLRFTGCPARGTAGYPRLDRISAECI